MNIPVKHLGHLLLIITSCFLLSSCQLSNKTFNNDNKNSSNIHNDEYFLVGTYTKKGSEGIYRLKLDHQRQSITNLGLVAQATNPSYLAFDNAANNVFAVTSDKTGGIDHFSWNNAAQNLTLKASIQGLGQCACHIAIHPEHQQLAIANYTSGEVYIVERSLLNNQFTLKGSFKNQGKGLTARQEAPHMHYVQWDKNGKYLYAVDLGTDEIKYFDSSATQLKAKVAAKLQPGDGPRHFIFHPTLGIAYVLNELSNTIVAFKHNESTGTFSLLARYPTSPNNKEGLPSAIRISQDGKFLYAAVRGDTSDHISVFNISTDGQLTHIQSHSTLGSFPRDINFSAQQNYLLVANQYGNSIIVLARDIESGLLSTTQMKVEISTPSFVASYKNDSSR